MDGIGTGSKQGKFSVQLRIKSYLEVAGYKTSLISTEPQGFLFGSDITFPIGHKPTVEINLGKWDEFVGISVKYIDYVFGPDIIITGIQGSVIPKHPVYMGHDTGIMRSLVYVASVYPDAIICCISPHDDFDFIQKTLSVIEAYVRFKLLFFALTPYTLNINSKIYKLDKIEYDKKLAFFENLLNKPVVDIFDKSNEKFIVRQIQETFSHHTANQIS